MNTAVRVIDTENLRTISHRISDRNVIKVSSPSYFIMILTVLVLLTAFAVIYLKDLNRRLFIESQKLQQIQQQQQMDWGKLLLEESTWATPSRIQQLAVKNLNMVVPNSKDVIVITLHSHSLPLIKK